MKYIHTKNILPYTQDIKNELETLIKENFDYIKTILCYIIKKGQTADQKELLNVFKDIVNNEEIETYMTTIAEHWQQQGFNLGLEQGIQKGVEQAKEEIIKKMFLKGLQISIIADNIDLSEKEIINILKKNNIYFN